MIKGGKLLSPYSIGHTSWVHGLLAGAAELEARTQLLEFVHGSFGVGDDGQKVQLLQDLGAIVGPITQPRCADPGKTFGYQCRGHLLGVAGRGLKVTAGALNSNHSQHVGDLLSCHSPPFVITNHHDYQEAPLLAATSNDGSTSSGTIDNHYYDYTTNYDYHY